MSEPGPHPAGAAAQQDVGETKPRVWTVFVVVLGGVFAQVLAGIVLIIPLLLSGDFSSGPPDDAQIDALFETPMMYLVSMVGTQLCLLAVLGAALVASPMSRCARLPMKWGSGSLAWLPLWCVASLGAGVVGEYISGFEQSDASQELIRAVQSAPPILAAAIVVLGALLPGFIEEMFFRSHVQTRLLQRWPAWLAIGISSILFAIFHLDPGHVVAVLPIGVWLGVLAWRLDGVLPGVVCHVFNNAVAFGFMVLEPQLPVLPATGRWALDGALLGSLLVALGVLFYRLPGAAAVSGRRQ